MGLWLYSGAHKLAFLAHAVLTTDEAVKAMGTVSNTWPAQ